MHQVNCLVYTAKSTCLFMIYAAYLHVTCSEIALCDDVETSLRYLPPLRPALPLSSLQNVNCSLYLFKFSLLALFTYLRIQTHHLRSTLWLVASLYCSPGTCSHHLIKMTLSYSTKKMDALNCAFR